MKVQTEMLQESLFFQRMFLCLLKISFAPLKWFGLDAHNEVTKKMDACYQVTTTHWPMGLSVELRVQLSMVEISTAVPTKAVPLVSSTAGMIAA